jgi:hypothetical protein
MAAIVIATNAKATTTRIGALLKSRELGGFGFAGVDEVDMFCLVFV